jgi:hypothetical protein
VVDGRGRSLGPSLGGDEVHRQHPPHVGHELMRLGHGRCLFAGELPLPLCSLVLRVGLLSDN